MKRRCEVCGTWTFCYYFKVATRVWVPVYVCSPECKARYWEQRGKK